MDNRTFGYIRVSSSDQNIDRQKIKILAYGVQERDIYIDKVSGKNFDRPEYINMKNAIREGDTVVIASLDRLGRNYEAIKTEWKEITSKADIVILDMDMLSTVGKQGLERALIADICFCLLSYVAEKERQHIKQRQQEGIKAAKEKGVKFGRRKINRPDNWEEVYSMWMDKEITAVKAIELLGLKRRTFYNLVNEYQVKIS